MTDYAPGKGNITKLITEALFLRLRLTGVASSDVKMFITNYFQEAIKTTVSTSNLSHKPKLIGNLKFLGDPINFPLTAFGDRELTQLIDDLIITSSIRSKSATALEHLNSISGLLDVVSSDLAASMCDIFNRGNIKGECPSVSTKNNVLVFCQNHLTIHLLTALSPLVEAVFQDCETMTSRFKTRISRGANGDDLPVVNIDKDKMTTIKEYLLVDKEQINCQNIKLINGSTYGETGCNVDFLVKDYISKYAPLLSLHSEIKKSIDSDVGGRRLRHHYTSAPLFKTAEDLNDYLVNILNYNLRAALSEVSLKPLLFNPEGGFSKKLNALSCLKTNLATLENGFLDILK